MSSHIVDGRPAGVTSLTPFLVVSPARAALDFYRDVFGARVEGVIDGPAGPDGAPLVMHADVVFDAGRLQLQDTGLTPGLAAPAAGEPQHGSIGLYVRDVDAVVARAAAAGATIVEPPADFASGDRYAALLDPVGRRWTVMTRVEDISPEESERRVREWAASLAG